MINQISIKNYKSLIDLSFSPTRINLLIGENGAGKSNILEALAIYSAAKSNMLSNEFLISRGIRPIDPLTTLCKLPQLNENTQVTDPEKIQIFATENQTPIGVWVYHDETDPYKQLKADIYTARPTDSGDKVKSYTIHNDTDLNHKKALDDLFVNYSKLVKNFEAPENIGDIYGREFNEKIQKVSNEKYLELQDLKRNIMWVSETLSIIDSYKNKKSLKSNFVIFNPEIRTLMGDKALSQIQPLGINGEGLFTLLKVMAESEPENFKDVIETASIFNWLEKIELDEDPNSTKILLKDRFMNSYISPSNANEGFLFTLFYASLFCSNQTPSIFAIENIDNSLNPRLCRQLIEKLIKKAKKYNKQVFLSTHNPAILDGMDLFDEDQSIFVLERSDSGETKVRKLTNDHLPKPKRDGSKLNLSEAFLRGYLGGLPTNF